MIDRTRKERELTKTNKSNSATKGIVIKPFDLELIRMEIKFLKPPSLDKNKSNIELAILQTTTKKTSLTSKENFRLNLI